VVPASRPRELDFEQVAKAAPITAISAKGIPPAELHGVLHP
jgi:hypothetical protein